MGHLRVPTQQLSDQDNRVQYGPLELQASGWSIAQKARQQLAIGNARARASKLLELAGGDPVRITAQLVGEAAGGGDEFARSLIEQTCTYLAEAICHLIALLCPRRIVIGGGVSLMGERVLFQPLRARLPSACFGRLPAVTRSFPPRWVKRSWFTGHWPWLAGIWPARLRPGSTRCYSLGEL